MAIKFIHIGLLTTLALIFLVADCSCFKKTLPVSQILVDRMPSADGFTIDRAELAKVTTQVLSSEEHVRLDLEKGREGSLRVRLRFEPNDEGVSQLIVSLKYSRGSGIETKQYFGSGSVPVNDQVDRSQLFEQALRLGIADLISSWRGEEQGVTGLLSTLERFLSGETVPQSLLLQSVHLLGVKKERAAVKPLTQLLFVEDPRTAIAALSALTNIADPAAVDAVTKFAERKPSDVRKQVVLALRQMGGKKAAAWLFTISTGHEDPEVRMAAIEALQQVESKLH